MHLGNFIARGSKALITPHIGKEKVFTVANSYSRSAYKQSLPSLKALAGVRVVASLLDHSRPVALCYRAVSQVGH